MCLGPQIASRVTNAGDVGPVGIERDEEGVPKSQFVEARAWVPRPVLTLIRHSIHNIAVEDVRMVLGPLLEDGGCRANTMADQALGIV
jgi:hypothetical protein